MIRLLEKPEAKEIMVTNHYLHRFPTGWTMTYEVDGVLVTFSIPANRNLETFLFKERLNMRELARLWAPDGHGPNALTQAEAVSAACKQLRKDVPGCQAVCSFADPNVGHHGGVYQACSWDYTGRSSETRAYMLPDGTPVSRRSFHSGSTSRKPDLPEVRLLGKERYVRCFTKHARRILKQEILPYPKPGA